ncbi:MAG TPA: hypothetical protein VK841_21425 [Polyangiaceae bacterium]|nr:hypothetical protein [Polyangiaceae bacterium]
MSIRRASVVLAVLAARCTFPDVSMVASSGPSGDVAPNEGGDPTGDSFPFADGGLGERDGESADASGDGSIGPLDATGVADAADASMRVLEAGAPAPDGASPIDTGAPRADSGAPGVDASKPPPDAGGGPDPGHDAGHTKQYPANVDCTAVDLADCNSTIGFADDPDCGDTGMLVQCGTSGSKNNGNGNGDGNDEASRNKDSCVILLQVSAVQTCL